MVKKKQQIDQNGASPENVAPRLEWMRLGTLAADLKLYRYLSGDKFRSLLQRRALWFSRLGVLSDEFEGRASRLVQAREERRIATEFAKYDHLRSKNVQRATFRDNEESGRRVLAVSCWSTSPPHDPTMWAGFAQQSDGVAIETTVERLVGSLYLSHQKWWIGHVEYRDQEEDLSPSSHEAAQAHVRAFVKHIEFAPEREVRLCTMNWVAPGCLNADGSPPTDAQRQGLSYDPERRGLFVSVSLRHMLTAVHASPSATREDHRANQALLDAAGVPSWFDDGAGTTGTPPPSL